MQTHILIVHNRNEAQKNIIISSVKLQSTKKNGKTLGKSKGKINRREKATRRIKRQHQTSRVSSKEAKHEIKTEKVPHTKCLVVG